MTSAASASRALPDGRWTMAVHLTHPEVPGWVFGETHATRLTQALPRIDCRLCADRSAFHTALAQAQMALVWSFRQEEFAIAPQLCLLATPAAGRDYFTVSPPPGVALFYGGFHGCIMAETAVGMLLAMCRGLLPAVTTYAADPWPRLALAPRLRPLRGAHVVIVGFGHIGVWIGRLLKPFGVRLTGVRRRPAPADLPSYFDAGDRLLSVDRMDEVLASADHVVVVLPADSSTDNLFAARRLALLPAHATLANLGRGNAIDEAALGEALRSGRLAGACLDVCRNEPLAADSPLRRCPNLWLFPHSSAISPTYMDLFVDDFVAQFRAWRTASA